MLLCLPGFACRGAGTFVLYPLPSLFLSSPPFPVFTQLMSGLFGTATHTLMVEISRGGRVNEKSIPRPSRENANGRAVFRILLLFRIGSGGPTPTAIRRVPHHPFHKRVDTRPVRLPPLHPREREKGMWQDMRLPLLSLLLLPIPRVE